MEIKRELLEEIAKLITPQILEYHIANRNKNNANVENHIEEKTQIKIAEDICRLSKKIHDELENCV